VRGKGGKERILFGDGSAFRNINLNTLRRELKKVGLKPHSLRKLFVTRLAKRGDLTDADLCEVMGWESYETARSYIQPDRADVLANKIAAALGGN
jgi:integrase